MALVEVARFSTLAEAHIAAAALRAQDLDAQVFDGHLGSVNWTLQQALGGFRVMAAEADAAAAAQMFATLKAPPMEDEAEPPKPKGLKRLAAAALILIAGG